MKLVILCQFPIKKLLSYTQENCGFLFFKKIKSNLIILKELKIINNSHKDNFHHYYLGYYNYKLNYAYAKDRNLVCVPFHTHPLGKQSIYPSQQDFLTTHRLSAVFINNRLLFYNKKSIIYNFKIKIPLLDKILILFL